MPPLCHQQMMMRMHPWLHLASNFNINANLFSQFQILAKYIQLFLEQYYFCHHPTSIPHPDLWGAYVLCSLHYFWSMTIHGPISNILIMCFIYYLFSWTMNPRPRIKHFDYMCCLLPSFLIHESTAPYQTSWLCVFFTTFFVHEHIPLYQTYWSCILFTIFFHPWIHTPDIKSLNYVFCLLPFFIHECTALNQTPWLCVLLTTCFDS